MSQFVRANKLTIIDLDSVSHIVHDPTGFSSMSGHTKVIQIGLVGGGAITVNESDEQYPWWLKYMERQQSLRSCILQEIRGDAFDPFQDEMPRTLFGLFQATPGSESWVLCLMHDGEGGIWHENESDQQLENALVSWRTFDEALEKLEAFKREREVTRSLPDSIGIADFDPSIREDLP